DLDAIADARPPSKRDGVTHAASRRNGSNSRIPKQPLTVAPCRSTLDDLALSKAIPRQNRGEGDGLRGNAFLIGARHSASQTRVSALMPRRYNSAYTPQSVPSRERSKVEKPSSFCGRSSTAGWRSVRTVSL